MTLVEIYRSTRKEGLYLYVLKGTDTATLPEPVKQHFGAPELAMTLPLDRERKLARANAGEVLDAIDAQGFYLQLPPQPGAEPEPR